MTDILMEENECFTRKMKIENGKKKKGEGGNEKRIICLTAGKCWFMLKDRSHEKQPALEWW
jgi:hypothetical protein